MSNPRRHLSPQEKVVILKRHLVEGTPVSCSAVSAGHCRSNPVQSRGTRRLSLGVYYNIVPAPPSKDPA
jgi:hypothetical protein